MNFVLMKELKFRAKSYIRGKAAENYLYNVKDFLDPNSMRIFKTVFTVMDDSIFLDRDDFRHEVKSVDMIDNRHPELFNLNRFGEKEFRKIVRLFIAQHHFVEYHASGTLGTSGYKVFKMLVDRYRKFLLMFGGNPSDDYIMESLGTFFVGVNHFSHRYEDWQVWKFTKELLEISVGGYDANVNDKFVSIFGRVTASKDTIQNLCQVTFCGEDIVHKMNQNTRQYLVDYLAELINPRMEDGSCNIKFIDVDSFARYVNRGESLERYFENTLGSGCGVADCHKEHIGYGIIDNVIKLYVCEKF